MSYFSLHVRAFVRGKEASTAKWLDQGHNQCVPSRPIRESNTECPGWLTPARAMPIFDLCLTPKMVQLHLPFCSHASLLLYLCGLILHSTLPGTPLQLSYLKQTVITLPNHLATYMLCYLPHIKCPLSSFPVESPSAFQWPAPWSFSPWNFFKSPQQVSIFSLCVESVALIIQLIPICSVLILLIYVPWIINKKLDVI